KSYKEALAAARAPWAQRPLYPNHSPPADVGIVSVDVPTGAIHTMLSGKHYKQDQINTVTTLHEPGSSFKPYLLASAFEEGIPPTKTYSGAQGAITDPRCETNGQPWVVTNAEGTSLGMLDLYTATAESVNAVFARLILDVGPDKLVQVAHKMGITSYLPPVCSLAVGAYGISPLDQASGYQTLANQGVHCVPYAVQKITQGDQVLFQARPDCYRAIPKEVANLVTDLLKGPVTYGTASSAFSGWGPWPIVGKTGTATDNKAVWFAGYTRQLSTAVWVGSLGSPYPLAEYWGYDVFGGSIAAPIWRAYMSQAMQGMPALAFPAPKLVNVPNVVGKTQSAGVQILRGLGFHVTTHTVGSYLPAGTIAEQMPTGGSQTIAGAQVSLGVSNGVAPLSKVPDVTGMTLVQAKNALTAANYFVSVVDKAVTDKKQDGVVLSQDPAGGSSAAEGTTVTLTVGTLSSGGGGGGGSPSPSPSPSSSPSPGH
ncbi:MAG: penicillin-binding transpeptidase domain-containing protein, partial [Actinomycetota bacterium]